MPSNISSFELKTPVAFLVFNRPDMTIRVFEEIRRARPPKLLVVADGPRADRAGETEKCKAVRAIIDTVDWSCEVLKNYSDVNLGCKIRVSSGLDWVFEQVEEAIILEDDCLPHLTFFRFSEELLERYRDDERVMHISGDNFQFGRKRGYASYYFAWYPHSWGWASWRRAWQYFDVGMKAWPVICRDGWLDRLSLKASETDYWRRIFQLTYDGKINTWDFQWAFACWIQNGLSIIPNLNLVSNIGFGPAATNTLGSSESALLPTEAIAFPLKHPMFMLRDIEADKYTFEKVIFIPIHKRILQSIKRRVKEPFKILLKTT
jgi:hypothetical protein